MQSSYYETEAKGESQKKPKIKQIDLNTRMLVNTYNPSNQEVEAGELTVEGQPEPSSKNVYEGDKKMNQINAEVSNFWSLAIIDIR